LTNVTSQAGSFTNEYFGGVPGQSGFSSSLVKRLLLPNLSIITNDFDGSARLLGTYLRTSNGTLTNKHEYIYNVANQPTNTTRTDSSTVGFLYDNIGQLKVADSSVPSEDRGYFYDAAWNLNRRTNNGSTTTVTVNSKNGLAAFGSQGSYTYDANGNLYAVGANTNFSYSYDDENRLVQRAYYQSDLGIGAPTGGDKRTDFTYDGLGRLRKRAEYSWTDGGGGGNSLPVAVCRC
jgi:hypothetical protein